MKHEKLNDKLSLKARELMLGIKDVGLAKDNKTKCVLTPPYYEKNYAERIRNFEVRSDDVWVVSFPKAGTTWTQEMVWCIANNVDLEGAKKGLFERFPFLEISSLELLSPDIESLPDSLKDTIRLTEQMSSPRFIKSHLPWSLLPTQLEERKPKIIYVARNPKDVAVSYYNHCRIMMGFTGTVDDFLELFISDKVLWAPYWDHVYEFWIRKNEPNILFLRYEEMKKDLPSILRKTAKFLDKSLKDEDFAVLTDHLSFNSMKNNSAVNYEDFTKMCKEINLCVDKTGKFIRKGEVNNWKNYFSPEMSAKFDQWTQDNLRDLFDLPV